MKKFTGVELYLVLLVIIGGIVQKLGVGILFGNKPNIVLAIMIAVACIGVDFGWYLILMAVSYAVLKTGLWWDMPVALMVVEFLFVYTVARVTPWRPLVTIVITTLFTTIVFYALLAWPLLLQRPTLFLGEALYTIIISIALHKILTNVGWNQ